MREALGIIANFGKDSHFSNNYLTAQVLFVLLCHRREYSASLTISRVANSISCEIENQEKSIRGIYLNFGSFRFPLGK